MASADVEQAQAMAFAANDGVSLTKEKMTPPKSGELLEDGVQAHTVPEDPEQKLQDIEGSIPGDTPQKATSDAKAVPAPDNGSPAIAADAEQAADVFKAKVENAEGGIEETEANAERFLVKYALWISIGTLLAGVYLTTVWYAAYNQEKRAPRGLPRKRRHRKS